MHEEHDGGFAGRGHWIALLGIATCLLFTKLRERAIRELAKLALDVLGPIERICLAQRYDITEWFRPAYKILCTRGCSLEVWEIEQIGLSVAIRLAKCRARLQEFRVEQMGLTRHRRSSSDLDQDTMDAEASRIIESVFWPPTAPLPDFVVRATTFSPRFLSMTEDLL